MEWTIVHHKFMGAEFFTVSTELTDFLGQRGKHTILVEYKDRRGEWEVGDVCDRGQGSMSLLKACLSYIDTSKRRNAGGIGHCEWMIEEGLPSLEDGLGKIISEIMVTSSEQKGSVN
jgi:hypothetical protein